MDTKQVIVIRKDLNMRKGKMVAQGAHASMKAILNRGYSSPGEDGRDALYHIPMNEHMLAWVTGVFTKICVGVETEGELIDLYHRAQRQRLVCSLVQDNGTTEFGGVPTNTAVAIGPGDPKLIDEITGHLNLL